MMHMKGMSHTHLKLIIMHMQNFMSIRGKNVKEVWVKDFQRVKKGAIILYVQE